MGIRNAEVQKHDHRWSRRSIRRWLTEPPGWRRTFALVCHAAMQPYAGQAGYDDSEIRADQVCAAPSGSPESRVSDPEYQPAPQFDFAYARRRARQRVAKILPVGSTVVDVGASTAAFAFMVDRSRVTAVDDGSPGKRVLARRWRERPSGFCRGPHHKRPPFFPVTQFR